ncbi:MAG TPA: hypothetical protein ACHBX6_07420 [Arsenophonus nasoniae]|uniref:hypothetical protein n=1 Tax=Arsenophonus nasoniae TaxID=638 RepID=UPI003879243A
MAVVSKFIRDLDPRKDMEEQLKETLNILVKLGEAKLENFKHEMNNSWHQSDEDSLAPGVTKDFQTERMHVMTKTDSKDAVGSAIAKTIESAFSLSQEPNGEKVGKFIEELATNGLDAVLGSGSASEDQYKQYIIYPDKDFLCRCDIWYWRYSIESKGFQEKLEHVVIYRMQYGAVDISRVDPFAVAHCFNKWSLDTESAKATLDQVEELMKAAERAKKLSAPIPAAAMTTSIPAITCPHVSLEELRHQLLRTRNLKHNLDFIDYS